MQYIFILLKFCLSSFQTIQYDTNYFINPSCFDILDQNNCHLFVDYQRIGSINNQICHKNDFNKQNYDFCLDTYINNCTKTENESRKPNYYSNYESKPLFSSNKPLINTHIGCFESVCAKKLILIPIFIFILVFIIKIHQKNVKKTNEINKSKLQPFVDSIINQNEDISFSTSYVKWLCDSVMPVFLSEPSLLELEPPICICGDIHGHLDDLLTAFKKGGQPPKATYLFLGDYVDRGSKSVDVICLLFALKLLYPKNVYILRGNHESPEINEVFGFDYECRYKLSHRMWRLFNKVFKTLPIGAVVGGLYFCIHGGLSPYLQSVNDIKEIERPISVFDDYILADVLWTDPRQGIKGWGPSPRGDTKTWGLDVAEYFLTQNNLRFIVRGHQMALNGYDFPFYPDKSTITVFTASKYDRNNLNNAAVMIIDEQKCFSFITW